MSQLWGAAAAAASCWAPGGRHKSGGVSLPGRIDTWWWPQLLRRVGNRGQGQGKTDTELRRSGGRRRRCLMIRGQSTYALWACAGVHCQFLTSTTTVMDCLLVFRSSRAAVEETNCLTLGESCLFGTVSGCQLNCVAVAYRRSTSTVAELGLVSVSGLAPLLRHGWIVAAHH